ncbi:hypothetical protein ACQEV2_41300 [Streptomyces sp. CA-251387]|uniref:hypothetical protein n=1 Tax=Streptomyces sp. CA-251387 TaxID=3240064 RepID=UPI003D92E489
MATLNVRVAAVFGAAALILSGVVALAPTASAVCGGVEVSSTAGEFCVEASVTATEVAAEGTTRVTSHVPGVVHVTSDTGESLNLSPLDSEGVIQGHSHIAIQRL